MSAICKGAIQGKADCAAACDALRRLIGSARFVPIAAPPYIAQAW